MPGRGGPAITGAITTNVANSPITAVAATMDRIRRITASLPVTECSLAHSPANASWAVPPPCAATREGVTVRAGVRTLHANQRMMAVADA
jgi:hypothetical protein